MHETAEMFTNSKVSITMSLLTPISIEHHPTSFHNTGNPVVGGVVLSRPFCDPTGLIAW